MKRLLMGLSLLLLLVGSVQAEQVKNYGLLFYADWCSACRVLEPKLTAVKPEFVGKPIEFITIDLTSNETAQASLAQADALGIGTVTRKNARATGFMLIVNAASKEVVDRIYANHSEQQIKEKLQRAVDS